MNSLNDSKPRKPEFFIIGAMKSATSTLQEQLNCQTGIFMSAPKEPNFFSDEEQFARGFGWYEALFSPAPEGALLGEASTHYAKLPTHPATVGRLRSYQPGARLIYVMRHPVDRLVSHFMHEWSMGNIDCGVDDAASRHPEMVAYGQYAMQLRPYFDAFGRESVLPVFFDRLVASPQQELERVCAFIGYRGEPSWRSDLAPSNVSRERVRRFPFYDLLVKSRSMTSVRRALVPKSVRSWVKGKLTLTERPALSAAGRAALEAEFDKDLAVLGDWLGVELNCTNFKLATLRSSLDWSSRND